MYIFVNAVGVWRQGSGGYLSRKISDCADPEHQGKNLSSDFIVTVIGDDSYHVTFCPLTYCYNVLSDQTGAYDDELKNVVKALYKYSQEADAYFPD